MPGPSWSWSKLTWPPQRRTSMVGPPFPSSIAIVASSFAVVAPTYSFVVAVIFFSCYYYSRCFFFFVLTISFSSSSSLMIHIDLYMGLKVWFCKWVWWVWDLDLDLRKPYGFDELRSRSRFCLDLMICMEEIEIEMEESQVEKRENVTREVRGKSIKKVKYKATITVHIWFLQFFTLFVFYIC